MLSLIGQIPGMGIGFVVGAFTPAIGRKIKSLFVKEGAVVKTAVTNEAQNLEKKL